MLLVAVLIGGKEIAGSKSWFQIGGIAIQPAEFAKFATALAMAKYLTQPNVNLQKFSPLLKGFIILGIPAVLILLQNDTGSALVFGAFALVLYREGMPGGILVLALGIATVFGYAYCRKMDGDICAGRFGCGDDLFLPETAPLNHCYNPAFYRFCGTFVWSRLCVR